jgi:RNA polymerase sigma-70 factor (family 1)
MLRGHHMDYRGLDDDNLLKLLIANDEGALKEIYLRYWKQLYLLALKKVRSPQVTEEIVQNVIVSLWHRRKLSAINHLESYLKVAVKYQVINFIKGKLSHEKSARKLLLTDEQEECKGESVLLARELSDAIDIAIRQLPEKTRQVFRMSRFEEQSVKEIAQTMNISEKAVEYHITKSLKILRSHLKDYILLALISLRFIFI